MYELLGSLENKCDKLSYYWVQYGLAAQLIGKYDAAQNHFFNASRIQPRSYQVLHASAKNYMERGIVDYSKNIRSNNFEYGKTKMKDLIVNPDYHELGYTYSLHAYIDMLIKFSYSTKSLLLEEDLLFIQNHLKDFFIQENKDIWIKKVTNQFIEYCETNGLRQYCEGIDKYSRFADEEFDSYSFDDM
jgi:hypothetical protein